MEGCRRAPRLAILTLLFLPVAASLAAAPSAQTIVDNELAFARSATEHGTRAGFLEYLADSSVVLGPAPTPGRAATERGPSPGAPLRWRPDLAAISGAGDFGWASGPFLSWSRSTDEPPAAAGHYFTVWRREEAGAWRVLLDGGVAYAVAEPQLSRHLDVTARLRHRGGGQGSETNCSQDFAALWQGKGRLAALKEYLADDARLLYNGSAPVDARKPWLRADPLAGASLAKLRVAKTLSSDGGDLLVAYGEYDIAPRLDAPGRRFVFVHAWDVGRHCRLAVEMLNETR